MDKNLFEAFLKFESKPWDELFDMKDVVFQLPRLGTIQMHVLQSIAIDESI